MEKEEKFLGKEEVPFLYQLIESMIEAESKLRKAYEKKDTNSFNEAKKFILETQKKISEVLK